MVASYWNTSVQTASTLAKCFASVSVRWSSLVQVRTWMVRCTNNPAARDELEQKKVDYVHRLKLVSLCCGQVGARADGFTSRAAVGWAGSTRRVHGHRHNGSGRRRKTRQVGPACSVRISANGHFAERQGSRMCCLREDESMQMIVVVPEEVVLVLLTG